MSQRHRIRGWAAVAYGLAAAITMVSALVAVSCSPDMPLPSELIPLEPDLNCGELTWENFGESFFDAYCLRCHDTRLLTDFERTDAPQGINFNQLAFVREFQKRIRIRAGLLGDMPPGLFTVPRPSEAERVMLIEWIDCGTPSEADLEPN